MYRLYIILLFVLGTGIPALAQPAPAVEENIPFLVTFGGDASTSWGDDDFKQIFFFVIPTSQVDPVYIRMFDPETGGHYDEGKGPFNTVVDFSVYAGEGCWTDSSAQSIHPVGETSGYLLTSRSFASDPEFDNRWYTFGPFNPLEGEYVKKLGGYVFKILAKGISGDDGNLYRYFLSTSPTENIPVEGGNFFTYKYHFRFSDDQKSICQIYPYVDDRTISIEVSNFDWDNDGLIRIYSAVKNGVTCLASGEDNWIVREFPIQDEEKNSTLEIQFIKNQYTQVRNNNVVIAIRNQYGESLPFYVIPIGGVPEYSPQIRMK